MWVSRIQLGIHFNQHHHFYSDLPYLFSSSLSISTIVNTISLILRFLSNTFPSQTADFHYFSRFYANQYYRNLPYLFSCAHSVSSAINTNQYSAHRCRSTPAPLLSLCTFAPSLSIFTIRYYRNRPYLFSSSRSGVHLTMSRHGLDISHATHVRVGTIL